MAENRLNQTKKSPYHGECILLTTKHHKSTALANPFEKILGAGILEHVVNTDTLGTFSGEIKRQESALETAKQKCEWSLNQTKNNFVLASEGSFGPHPVVSFTPANQETLFFIDKDRGFSLHLTQLFTETNYRMQVVTSIESLKNFAKEALFPSHALIVRPDPIQSDLPIFKGIVNAIELEDAFLEAKYISSKQKVWVETDMRAHQNPTRMKNIGILGEIFAQRLCQLCPSCQTPGWGEIDVERGLPCGDCHAPTHMIKKVFLGCTLCDYREASKPKHTHKYAQPQYCEYCNP